MTQAKLLVDYKSPDGPEVIRVRSTLLISGVQALREFGHYDRYVELLPKELHEKILYATTAEWLPVELAWTHYRVCDALGLGPTELDAIGQHVSHKIMGSFIGTLTRSTRGVGVSPWLPLRNYDRLWERILLGGVCQVEEVGPKDAIVRSCGIPMLETVYFRTAYLGVVRGAGLLFSKTVRGRALPNPNGDPRACAMQFSWV